MGKTFIERHLWANETWFKDAYQSMLEVMEKSSIKIGVFDPLASNKT